MTAYKRKKWKKLTGKTQTLKLDIKVPLAIFSPLLVTLGTNLLNSTAIAFDFSEARSWINFGLWIQQSCEIHCLKKLRVVHYPPKNLHVIKMSIKFLENKNAFDSVGICNQDDPNWYNHIKSIASTAVKLEFLFQTRKPFSSANPYTNIMRLRSYLPWNMLIYRVRLHLQL